MTLDEKLANFTEYCVLAAKKKSEELISQQQSALDKDFEAYTLKSKEITDSQLKIEKEINNFTGSFRYNKYFNS